jgi:hypothetical protein
MDDPEIWRVDLLQDGCHVSREVKIWPPFGIRCADAEVKAIKEARAAGAASVSATGSTRLRVVSP